MRFLLGTRAVALGVAFLPACIGADLMMSAWPLLADWTKYTIRDAGALGSLDAARPISVPLSLQKVVGDDLRDGGA